MNLSAASRLRPAPPLWRRAAILVAFCALFLIATDILWAGTPGDSESETPESEAPQDSREQPAEATEEEEPEEYRMFDELAVIGSPDALREIAGSAHVITATALERQSFQDVHRVLRQVPGVNVQEEDGFGLRPNIGIRGTGVERSSKVTLLEDGVLIAPAPYAAPAAYYAPTAGRMEGFEIRKGSGAIRQGPYTNGGSINYLSSSIPGELGARVDLAAGTDGLRRSRARVGSSGERVGWLIEAYDTNHDGFKSLDGGGGTGFRLGDYLAKFRVHSGAGASRPQALELKLGWTDQRADETYVGLTAADFERDPYRRYAGSAGDRIESDHQQIQLSYQVQLSDRLTLTAAAYRNDFFRNWAKLEKIDGIGVTSILASPATHQRELAILKGELDSDAQSLAVRNNRRDYRSNGLQAVLGVELGSAKVRHAIDLGLRLHEDEEDRFQEEDAYRILDGRRVFSAAGVPGSQANRVAIAEATAIFVEDTVRVGRWTITPGFRVESIDLLRRDFGGGDPRRAGTDVGVRQNSLTELIPGVGVSLATDHAGQLFFGVHRGFSPPSPSSKAEVGAEESINYELGYRASRAGTTAELTGFFNDYDNLLGTDTTSGGGGGSGDQSNGGAATVYGLEAGASTRLFAGERVSLPVTATYTYTRGRFDSSFESAFADWAPEVSAGDALPYLPEHQLNTTWSLMAESWSAHVDVHYSAAMRTRAGHGAIPEDSRVDSRWLLDLRGEIAVGERYHLFAQLLNATDEVYIAARRPAGLRPGLPRSLVIGVKAGFRKRRDRHQ